MKTYTGRQSKNWYWTPEDSAIACIHWDGIHTFPQNTQEGFEERREQVMGGHANFEKWFHGLTEKEKRSQYDSTIPGLTNQHVHDSVVRLHERLLKELDEIEATL